MCRDGIASYSSVGTVALANVCIQLSLVFLDVVVFVDSANLLIDQLVFDLLHLVVVCRPLHSHTSCQRLLSPAAQLFLAAPYSVCYPRYGSCYSTI